MTEPPFERLGIVGLGLIGGSIALRARATWPGLPILALDTGGRAVEAVRRGLVNEAVGELAQVAAVDLLVLAVPITSMPVLLKRLGQIAPAAVVTDVGSTKRFIMRAATDANLPSFTGGHPMAGAEQGGLEHARADLFDERVWWLIKGNASADSDARLERFVTALGARPQWNDADTHDRVVAYVSHLPQVLATTLMTAASDCVGEEGMTAAGPAFAEMTRLASSPAHVWTGIFEQNGDLISEALESFVARLPDQFRLHDAQWVQATFEAAAAARMHWQRLRSARTHETGT